MKENILLKANELVTKDRAEEHGNMHTIHARAAQLWETWLEVPISAHDVAMCMALLKVARMKENPKYQDNYNDLAGWAQIAWSVKDG